MTRRKPCQHDAVVALGDGEARQWQCGDCGTLLVPVGVDGPAADEGPITEQAREVVRWFRWMQRVPANRDNETRAIQAVDKLERLLTAPVEKPVEKPDDKPDGE